MQDHTTSLAGVRVVDFTQNLPGPYATHILAQLGAEVLKIEPPTGDPARAMPNLFDRLNAGKRSVVADLKQPEGLRRVHELVGAADVVVEGFRPGVLARFDLDASRCRAGNPRLVYCSISGYGQSGRYRDYPSHDLNLQALAGLCDLDRDARGTPRASVLPLADLSSGLMAALLMLDAIHQQCRTGAGATLDVALLDTLSSWVSLWEQGLKLAWPSFEQVAAMIGAAGLGRSPRARAVYERAQRLLAGTRWVRELKRRRLYALPHYDLFATRDRPLALGVLNEERFWRRTADALGLGRLGDLPWPARLALRRPLALLLRRRLRRSRRSEWLARLDPAAVPVTPVAAAHAVAADAHVGERLRGLPFLAVSQPGRGPSLGEHDGFSPPERPA